MSLEFMRIESLNPGKLKRDFCWRILFDFLINNGKTVFNTDKNLIVGEESNTFKCSQKIIVQ